MSTALAEPHVTTADVRTHYVYRLFDRDGVLLYIGMTVDPKTRFTDHARKPWWGDVADRLLEETPTRADAFYLEALAILRENPRYNISIPSYDRLDELRSRATKPHGGISPEERIAALEARLHRKECENRANLASLGRSNHELAKARARITSLDSENTSIREQLTTMGSVVTQLRSQGSPENVQLLQGRLEELRQLHRDSIQRESDLLALHQDRAEPRIFVVEAPKCHAVPAPVEVAAAPEPMPGRWRSMFIRR